MKTANLSTLGVTMKRSILVAVTLLMGVVGTVPARADCMGAPLASLTGQWAFQITGTNFFGGVVTGVFTAGSSGGRSGGSLNILTSSNLANIGVYGESAYQGVYDVDATCTKGVLQFASGRPNLEVYDFYFTNAAKTEAFLIGMEWNNPFAGIMKKIQ
jgi:hypothetical protein